MNEIKITIPGSPVPWKAPTFGKGRAYSIQKAIKDAYETYIALQYTGKVLTGPISVKYRYFMRRPDNHWGTGKNIGGIKPSAPQYYIVKRNDIDNLDKFISDRMNKIVFKDDSQIVEKHSRQRYSNSGNPRTEVIVMEV